LLIVLGGAASTSLLAACTPSAAPSPAATTAPPPPTAAQPAATQAAAPAAAATTAPAAKPTVQVVSTPAAASAPAAAGTPAAAAVGTGPTYTPAKLDGVELNMWILDFAPFKDYWPKLADRFGQLTGAKITFQPQAWPLEVKLIAAMSAGTVPDAIQLMGRVLAPLVPPKQDLLEPTDDSVFKVLGIDPKTYFAPGAIGCFEYNGQHWGIPMQDNVASTMIYTRAEYLNNSSAAKALWPRSQGMDYFPDFETVWNLAKTLQQESGGQVTVWGTNSEGWNRTNIFSVMKMLGVDWWDNQNKKFNMDSDAAVQAIEKVITTPSQKLNIETELNQTAEDAFIQGKVAVARSTISTQSSAADQGFEIVNAAAPPPAKGTALGYVGEGGWGAAVPRQSKQKDAALELMKWLVTPDAQKIWLPIFGGTTPSVLAMRNDQLYQGNSTNQENTRTWLKYQPMTTYMGSGFGHEPEISSIWEAIGQDVRSGKSSSKEASQAAQEQFTAHFNDFYSS
jgi:ABC-type glycerol-3-phosphate transport system substrate-binding protein